MIIVGLTTIPERLEKGLIIKCIKSMLEQTVPVDYIVVNIPAVSRKGIKYNHDKAQVLSNLDKRVVVRWGIKDEGPITKLFGTLDFIQLEGIVDGKVVLVDDDVQYDRRLIQVLTSQNHPAVGFAGRKCFTENNKVKDLWFYDERYKDDINGLNFLETFASVCYDIRLFDVNAMRTWLKELPPDSFYVDDIVIGAWLWKNNGTPHKIRTDEKLYHHDAEDTPQLSQVNLANRNLKVFTDLYALGYFNNHRTDNSSLTNLALFALVIISILILLRYR